MTQTGYSNAIVNAMLGWLKGLASWVLKLFNLSGGFSPLKFLADNWLQLLVFFLILGVALDVLVWLIRWRPHWVWFRKKRVVINDKNFFANERYIDDTDDWDAPARPAARSARTGKIEKPRQDWVDSDFVVRSEASKARREKDREARRRHVKSMQMDRQSGREQKDVFMDDLFNVNAKQKFSDKYEDEVFNVSNLPRPQRKRRPEGKPAAGREEKPERSEAGT